MAKTLQYLGMDGVLVIDKPAGLTSHDVVARVRAILHQRRIGHTGTLDPFATGVLVILVNRATRLAQFLSGAEKEYEAVIRLGYATDTRDITGKPTSDPGQVSLPNWTDDQIEAALETLRGEIDQVPPMYSAKKRDGQRLYELARRGEQVDRVPIRVSVHRLEAVAREGQWLKANADGTVDLEVHVVCSAGTYIRTLAESLGSQLGVGAHLAELRRTRAGDFRISDAVSLEQLKARVDEELLATVLTPLAEALKNLPYVRLNADDSRRVSNGIDVHVDEHSSGAPTEGQNVRILDPAGSLLAIGCYYAQSKSLHPKVVISSSTEDSLHKNARTQTSA